MRKTLFGYLPFGASFKRPDGYPSTFVKVADHMNMDKEPGNAFALDDGGSHHFKINDEVLVDK